MKYLNKFDTASDYEASASTLEIPNVAYITATTEVIYDATVKTYIVFADPLVASKCATLYGDGTGCTEEDLAAVTALNRNDWSGTSITSFDELGYFTGVKSIPIALFSDCTDLTSVTIPSSVTRFWESSFQHCSSLSAITFPASVTRIGENTFSGCSSLSSITFEATTLPATINSGAFDSLPTTGNITVPVGSESNFYSLAQSLGAGWTVNNQSPA